MTVHKKKSKRKKPKKKSKIEVDFITGHAREGKTKYVVEKHKKTTDRLTLFSKEHDFLKEQEVFSPNSRRIEGLYRICPCLKKGAHYNNRIAKLQKAGLSHRILCDYCQKINAYTRNKCPYHNQFKKTPNIILAPANYVFTSRLKGFKPDHIVIDDCSMMLNCFSTRTELNKKVEELTIDMNLEELIESKRYYYNYNILKNSHEVMLENMIDGRKVDMSFWHMYKLNIDPHEINIYRDYTLKHKYGYMNQFAKHVFYPLYDYITENPTTKLTIIDSIPNELILKELNNRYQHETGHSIDFNFKEIKLPNPTPSTIYRCSYKKAWYPATQSIVYSPKTRKNIKRRNHTILWNWYSNPHNLTIGVIKPKRCKVSDFIDTDKYSADYLNWGALRGKKHIEDSGVGFTVGSYVVNKDEMFNDFRLYFAREPLDKSESERDGKQDRFKYPDKLLDALRFVKEDYEQYQGIMRFGLQRQTKNIFSWGLIPEELLPDYITVKNLNFLGMDSYYKKKSRESWLEYIVTEEGGGISERDLRTLMMKEFNIKDRQAAREIQRIVDGNSDYIIEKYDEGRYKPKWVFDKRFRKKLR